MRASGKHFKDSLAALDIGQRAAIYVGNKTRKVLLIQTPNNERVFSIKIGNGSECLPETCDWASDDSDEKRVLFDRIVKEILEADDMVSGKYDLQKRVALFILILNCGIGSFSWGDI
jgi:hypothetical protein